MVRKDVRDERRNDTNSSFLPHFNSWWFVENQGNGVALNIHLECEYFHKRPDENNRCETDLNPIPPMGSERLKEPSCAEQVRYCTIAYFSLDGRKFISTFGLESGALTVQFKQENGRG